MGRLGFILSLILALGAGSVSAQTDPPLHPAFSSFQGKIESAVRPLASEPRFRRLSPADRLAMLEFVVGNMLFTVSHEMGHAVIGQMELPVLGREEDAADSFAIIGALKIGTECSQGVLHAAAQAWFSHDRRDRKQGTAYAFYGEHGVNLQRGYQVVCLAVGSDPEKFSDLADQTDLPDDRRKSCQIDYNNTAWSWDKLLAPYRRAPDAPKQVIDAVYQDATGPLAPYAQTFREMQFLETVAEYFAGKFAWPNPLTLEMKSCGQVNARWRPSIRTVELCYEMAEEYARLYQDYGPDWMAEKPKR